jgi:hypothetical protein
MFTSMQTKASGLVMILAVGGALSAQTTTSSLSGRVQTPAGAPIPNARVQLSSTALFQTKSVLTDAKGEWHQGLLPPGSYNVTVSLPTCYSVSQALRLGVGRSEAINVVLRPILATGATVEVVSASQVVDAAAETKVATSFRGEDVQDLPTGSYTAVAAYAPGVNNSFVVRGATGATQIRFVVDGVDTRDEKAGYSMMTPIMDTVEDLQMVLSAVNARNGRSLGSQMVMVTKQGGNTFEGSIRANYSRQGLWQSDYAHASPSSQGGGSDDITNRYYEWYVSGPVLKDRLWFIVSGVTAAPTATLRALPYWSEKSYGSADLLGPMKTRIANTDAVLKAGPGNGYTTPVSTVSTPFNQMNDKKQMDVRISGLIAADHTLDLKLSSYETGNSPMLPGSQGNNYTLQSELMTRIYQKVTTKSLSYKGALLPNVLVEATYSRADKDIGNQIGSVNGAPTAVLTDLQSYNPAITRYLVGGTTPNATISGAGAYNLQMMRNAASPVAEKHGTRTFELNVKSFLSWMGSHEIDTGFEQYSAVYNPGTQFGANNSMVYAGGWFQKGSDYLFPTVVFEALNKNGQNFGALGPAPVLLEAYAPSADQYNTSRAAWINDTWSVNNHVSLTLGLRWNRFRMDNPNGAAIQNDTALEPRFQLKLDPAGNGRNVFSLAFTRNNLSFNSTLSALLVTNPANYYTLRGWQGQNQPSLSSLGSSTDNGQYGVRFVNYSQLTDPSNYATVPYAFVNGSVQNRMQNLKAPFADQAEISFVHHYSDGGMIRISALEKRFVNETISYQDYSWDFLALSVDPSGRGGGIPQWLWQTRWTSNPDPRILRSVEIGITENVTPKLALNLSWTYTHETKKDATGRLNWAAIKASAANPLPANVYLADGVTRNDHRIAAFGTWTERVGKGKIQFTTSATYDSTPVANLSATQYFTMPTGLLNSSDPAHNPNNYKVASPGTLNTLTAYYNGGIGQFKSGRDNFNLNLMINFTVPLGYQRVMLIGSLGVTDILHRVEYSGDYGTKTPLYGNGAGQPTGRALGDFSYGAWGSNQSGTPTEQSLYYSQQRAISYITTLGLRF